MHTYIWFLKICITSKWLCIMICVLMTSNSSRITRKEKLIAPQLFSGGQKWYFFFRCKYIHCRYSLEALYWGTSGEYLQYMYLWRNKKNVYPDTPMWSYKGFCMAPLQVKSCWPRWLIWMCHAMVIRRLWGWTPPGRQHSFVEIWSWNIFCGHSLPSAASRRAVVSF